MSRSTHVVDDLKIVDRKMLSLISHELRNSFSHILGICNVMLKDQIFKKNDLRELIVSIQTTSDKSFVLLDNLLYLTKLKEDDYKKHCDNVNLEEIIRKSIEFYRFQIDQKNLLLILNLVKDLEIKTDKGIIQFILRNILSNAIKYSKIGGRIEINSKINPDFVEIIIADNGIGMKPSTINQIYSNENIPSFEGNFFENGYDLGLKLTNHFIKRIDGNMVITSTPSEGTKIKVSIPN